MAFPMHIDIHPLMPAGTTMVVNREVVVGVADVAGPGRGHLDVFVPTFEGQARQLFEKPIEVRDGHGKVTRVLQPWTQESIQYILQEGLGRQGLAGETRNP